MHAIQHSCSIFLSILHPPYEVRTLHSRACVWPISEQHEQAVRARGRGGGGGELMLVICNRLLTPRMSTERCLMGLRISAALVALQRKPAYNVRHANINLPLDCHLQAVVATNKAGLVFRSTTGSTFCRGVRSLRYTYLHEQVRCLPAAMCHEPLRCCDLLTVGPSLL
jgi:hypothetical protein